MPIKNRIAKLESRLAEQQFAKRGVPDWLQSEMESHGWIFDDWGQLLSAPDPQRYTRQMPLKDRAGEEARGEHQNICHFEHCGEPQSWNADDRLPTDRAGDTP